MAGRRPWRGTRRRSRFGRHPLVRGGLAVALLAVLACGSEPMTAGSAQAPRGLSVEGPRLLLDGEPVRLTGVNGFSLTTLWSTNWGCGAQVGDLDAVFGALPRGSLVRTWAFQALGFDNKRTQAIDFAGIDRVVRAAERHGVLLSMALSDQAGTCDDGRWHDSAWYAGGFETVRNDDGRGLTPVSYAAWVDLVVTRYRDSPVVAVWQPVNEPEAADCDPGLTGGACFGHSSCPVSAPAVLREFFDRVGGRIHALDPGSLVSSGVIGSSQCGIAGDGFAQVHASPGIDVATFHDHGAEEDAMPDELAERLRQAGELGKPLLVDEAGVAAGPGCRTSEDRAALLREKRSAAFRLGADGYLPWTFDPAPAGCSTGLSPREFTF